MRVLFLCSGNSCRSQMAEAWARQLWPASMQLQSAGTVARGLDPRAVRVMAEAGLDISWQHSKSLDELKDLNFDVVVTVCDDAHESCPVFPGRARILHHGFEDPPAWRKNQTTRMRRLLTTAACGMRFATSWRLCPPCCCVRADRRLHFPYR